MKIIKGNKGFTLVELIVAVGIFVTSVTIAIGALVALYGANNKSQSLASVINSLSFSIENMTRDIRFATTYHCGNTGTLTQAQNCSSGDVFLAISTSTTPIIYRFQSGKLTKSYNNGSTYTDVTSSEVTIEYAKFFVYYSTPGDVFQPHVLLVLRGYSGEKPSEQSRFDIQTVISQRSLDL